jgi:hypothetical protein
MLPSRIDKAVACSSRSVDSPTFTQTGTLHRKVSKNGATQTLDKVLLDSTCSRDQHVDHLVLTEELDDFPQTGRDKI